MNMATDHCDLSEQFGGARLHVRIIGVGESKTDFVHPAPLSDHVRVAYLKLTRREIKVSDPKNAPWCLVSFNRYTGELVVEPVRSS